MNKLLIVIIDNETNINPNINPYIEPNILSNKFPKLDFWKFVLIRLLIFFNKINDIKNIKGIDKIIDNIFDIPVSSKKEILFMYEITKFDKFS